MDDSSSGSERHGHAESKSLAELVTLVLPGWEEVSTHQSAACDEHVTEYRRGEAVVRLHRHWDLGKVRPDQPMSEKHRRTVSIDGHDMEVVTTWLYQGRERTLDLVFIRGVGWLVKIELEGMSQPDADAVLQRLVIRSPLAPVIPPPPILVNPPPVHLLEHNETQRRQYGNDWWNNPAPPALQKRTSDDGVAAAGAPVSHPAKDGSPDGAKHRLSCAGVLLLPRAREVAGASEHGRYWLLGRGDNTIGREPNCTVVIAESTTSRHHAEIRCEDGYFWLRDLHSDNGTYRNGQRVESGGHVRLHSGDRVRFGAQEMRFLAIHYQTDTSDDL